jgi:hypothetical protein
VVEDAAAVPALGLGQTREYILALMAI